MAKLTRKNKVRFGNKSVSFETSVFSPSGHISYSGFGAHSDKNRRSERRQRKEEQKRVMRGDW
jgi:hypothetical protein